MEYLNIGENIMVELEKDLLAIVVGGCGSQETEEETLDTVECDEEKTLEAE